MERLRSYYFPFSSLKEEKEDGLLRRYPKEQLRHHPVVCWTLENEHCHNGVERRYGVFESVRSLHTFYERLPDSAKTGYEVILGCYPQKPHFDIDIKTMEIPGDSVMQLLVDVIQAVLGNRGVQLQLQQDIAIYTSHGDGKQSYHLVLTRYAHANNLQAKAFADEVRAQLPSYARIYVDAGVYNPLQQFRLLGSTKIAKNRPKKELLSWRYHNQEIKTEPLPPLEALARSLVGWTAECTPLPIWSTPEPSFVPKRFLSVEAEEALALLEADPALNGCKFKASNKGSVISLQRLTPGYCPVCERVHEHDNAYLIVKDEKVYYKCHRARTEGLRGSSYLGTIPSSSK
jgi:hypothetical protein